MPIYEYRCDAGHLFEVFASMSDPPPTECEVCQSASIEKVLHPAAIHYKGSGFYATDYQNKKGRSSEGDGGKKESDGDSTSSSSGSESGSSGKESGSAPGQADSSSSGSKSSGSKSSGSKSSRSGSPGSGSGSKSSS